MSTPRLTSYDVVPYTGHAFPETHPDRLHTLAHMMGMSPAPVESCRVLELGCGDGGNLLPMAYALPGCRFVGLDLSGTAIATARGAADVLGLRNLTLHHADLLAFAEELGEFDYIIAHGLYSWVPDAVRDKLMEIAGTRLAPQGVAYVSYSCYPGAHLTRMLREMLQYHVAHESSPGAIARRAQELAALLEVARAQLEPADSRFEMLLRPILEGRSNVIFHDHLSAEYHPIYFTDFVQHAARHRLQYLDESWFHRMSIERLPPEVTAALRAIPESEIVRREQYVDFVQRRGFRHTLLCRSSVDLDVSLAASRVKDLYISGRVCGPSTPGPLDSGEPEVYSGPLESSATATQPLQKALLRVIGGNWPRRLTFAELAEETCRALRQELGAGADSAVGPDCAADLREALLQLYSAGMIGFHSYAPALAAGVSGRPLASAVVRWQLLSGGHVTTLTHETVEIEGELARRLVMLSDGSRTREEILDALRRFLLSLPEDERPQLSAELLDAQLHKLVQLCIMHS